MKAIKALLISLIVANSVQANVFNDIGNWAGTAVQDSYDWVDTAAIAVSDAFSECPNGTFLEVRTGYCEPYEESKRTFVCTEETCTLRKLLNKRK